MLCSCWGSIPNCCTVWIIYTPLPGGGMALGHRSMPTPAGLTPLKHSKKEISFQSVLLAIFNGAATSSVNMDHFWSFTVGPLEWQTIQLWRSYNQNSCLCLTGGLDDSILTMDSVKRLSPSHNCWLTEFHWFFRGQRAAHIPSSGPSSYKWIRLTYIAWFTSRFALRLCSCTTPIKQTAAILG